VAPPLWLQRGGSGRHPDRGDAARRAKRLALGTVPAVLVPPAEVRIVRALWQPGVACRQTARARRNRATRARLRAGWAIPTREPVTPGLAAPGAAGDEPTRVLVTRALTRAEQAAAEADRLRRAVLRRAQGQPALGGLWSLPGVGPWVAVVLWATLGAPHRLRSARPVTRYARLDPPVHQSGEADSGGHIAN
jgi:transposase